MREPQPCYVSLIVSLFTYGCLGQISFDVKPANVAGVKGVTSSLLLPCSISSPDGAPDYYQWTESGNTIFINANKDESHGHSDEYSLQTPGGDQWTNYNLVVQTSILDVASKYRCYALRGADVYAYADVLLLDTQPACAQSLNGQPIVDYAAGEDAEISCEVTYRGSWAPVMDWSNTDLERDETVGDIVKWVFDIPDLTPENDGDSFTCTTSFDAPTNPGDDDATNAPVIDDVQPCSVTLLVLYPPQNTQIVEDSASVGGTLTCESEANPAVLDLDYEWTIGDNIYYGKSVDLLEIHAGDNNITCCASNEIRGTPQEECVKRRFDVQSCLGLSFDTKPANVAGVKGVTSSLVLPCEINSPDGEPHFYQWTDSTNAIFLGEVKQEDHDHSDEYSLQNPGSDQWTKYSLVVQTSILDVASRYRCHASRIDTVDAYADVLLLDTQPVCLQDGQPTHEYVAGEDAEMSCQVTFAGSWPPVMAWSNTSNEEDLTSGDLAKWAFTVQNLTPEHNNQSFTCTTSYSAPPNPGNDDATNAPDIDGVQPCSVTLHVLYAPHNTQIEEEKATIGGTLSCLTDANPEVENESYVWKINGITYNGQTIDLPTVNKGEKVNAECCGSNEIRGVIRNDCDSKILDVVESAGNSVASYNVFLWMMGWLLLNGLLEPHGLHMLETDSKSACMH